MRPSHQKVLRKPLAKSMGQCKFRHPRTYSSETIEQISMKLGIYAVSPKKWTTQLMAITLSKVKT